MTILIWVIIAIIGVVASIMVRQHYKGNELEKGDVPTLNDASPMNSAIDAGKNILSRNNDNSKSTHSQLNNSNSYNFENEASFTDVYEEPVAYEVKNDNTYGNVEYESPNQVLIDYGNNVEKFQEPIKQSQMDIMTQNNNEKHELKDLFTIDEIIKESKRKDSEREKETHADDDEEINELKESIKQRQENPIEDALIEEVIDNEEETVTPVINEVKSESEAKETINDIITETVEEPKAEETINDIITETVDVTEEETETADAVEEEESINDLIGSKDDAEEKIESAESETPIVTSQDIEEAISTASQEVKEEPKSISESTGITDVLLDNVESEAPEEEIKEPILKTPTKVDETKEDYKFGADIKDSDVFGEYDNDLDYRKDLAKITNTIKGSKIFRDVKEKLISEPDPVDNNIEEDFIRNVNDYDDFEPIINETHSDFEATYEEYHKADFDDGLRQKNTENVFSVIKDTPEKPAESNIAPIKEKPSRDNIKIQINNNEVVLKKGDEIIFNHLGETYSSKVYAINGDDISVKYRRQNITIKPSDVKKVY